jgi:hypothetical protein
MNAPLIGPTGAAPTYDQDKASVFWYSPSDWKRHLVANDIPGIIHRVRPVVWDAGPPRASFSSPASKVSRSIARAGTGNGMTFEKQLLSRGHEEKRRVSARATSVSARRTGNASWRRSSRGTATRS